MAATVDVKKEPQWNAIKKSTFDLNFSVSSTNRKCIYEEYLPPEVYYCRYLTVHTFIFYRGGRELDRNIEGKRILVVEGQDGAVRVEIKLDPRLRLSIEPDEWATSFATTTTTSQQ